MNMQNCDVCDKEFITDCIYCEKYLLDIGIRKIQEYITLNLNFKDYIFYFNNKYYDDIEKALNLDVITNKVISNNLQDNEICIIIDKKLIDWGTFII